MHPKAYFERAGEKEFNKRPIYAGPFKFIKQKQGDYTEMEAYEGHYRQVPGYKKFILKAVPEPSTQLAMLKTGEADVAYQVPMGPIVKEIKQDPDLQAILLPGFGQRHVAFNDLVKKGNPPTPFRDKRVRQALSYAINRDILIEKIFYGAAEPSSVDSIGTGSPQWHPSCTPFPYDIEKAKALLAEAGYAKGLDTQMILTTRDKTVGEAVATMWNRIGVKTRIVMMEMGAFVSGIKKRTLPSGMRMSGHAISPTGIWYYFRNDQIYTAMLDDKLDRLTRKMGSFPEGDEMYAFIKNEMCRYVYDMVPTIPIVDIMHLHGVRSNVDTTEWVRRGARGLTKVPIAEYLRPKY
jgi:peptide/nickel transport system substrate-binding protein